MACCGGTMAIESKFAAAKMGVEIWGEARRFEMLKSKISTISNYLWPEK
jgi:hypothetical protein